MSGLRAHVERFAVARVLLDCPLCGRRSEGTETVPLVPSSSLSDAFEGAAQAASEGALGRLRLEDAAMSTRDPARARCPRCGFVLPRGSLP